MFGVEDAGGVRVGGDVRAVHEICECLFGGNAVFEHSSISAE